jgi:hypothetical protein
LFSNDTANKAAALANQGLQQGYGQLSDLYGQGRNAITSGYDTGRGDVTSNYGAGRDALTTGYNNADNIWSNVMTNYDNLYKGGASAYGDVSGANGVEGLQRGTDLFKNSGQYGVYGFANDQAQQALQRAHAAAGNALSGNADTDAMKYAAGLAGQNWGQFQQGLQPYLNNYGTAIGTVGAGRANNAAALASGLNASFTGQGNALGALDTGQAGALNASDMAQGSAANQTQTGIGQNLAGAELNNYNVGANTLNALLGAGKLITGTTGSGGVANLGTGLSSLFSAFKQ